MRVRSRSGFTLVEVLVALVILGMSVVTIVSLQSVNTQKALYANQLTTATLLARSIMVDAYLENYRRKLSGTIKDEKQGQVRMGGLDLKWEWKLTEVPFQIPEEPTEEEKEKGEEPTEKKEEEEEQNPLFAPIIKSINNYFKSAMRELSVHVTWKLAEKEESIYYTTMVIDFSHPLEIPSIPMPGFGLPSAAPTQNP